MAKDYLDKTKQKKLQYMINLATPLSQVATLRRRRCPTGGTQGGVGRDIWS
jgi:hypothetical protein